MIRPGIGRLFRIPLRRRDLTEQELDEEIQLHLELRIEQLERQGLSPEVARAEAMRRFGPPEEARRVLQRASQRRDARLRLRAWFDSVRQDSHYAVRTLRKSPSFTFVAVLILALGIGSATAVFSVADWVLLRPLPIQDEDRVVLLERRAPEGASLFPLAYADFTAFRERSRTLQDMAGVQYDGAFPRAMMDDGEVANVVLTGVSAGFFRVLGARPAAGRLFVDADDDVGAAPVVVISHALWQRRYGGDPAAVGRTLQGVGSEQSLRIVGVAPRGFEYPAGVEVWYAFPVTSEMVESRFAPFSLVGRLRPGATVEQAEAEAQAFLRERESTAFLPHEPRGHRIAAVSFTEAIIGDVRPAMLILSAAVGLVLLLASVNVANLLLIRGVRRERELAVRAALGAARGRLARQLLAESAVLAVAGGLLGVFLAFALVKGLLVIAPPHLPRLEGIRVDGRALGFAVLAVIAATLLAGFAPVWWSSRADLHTPLRSGARGGTDGRGVRLGKQVLVVWQVALALIVTAGAGLLVRTLWNLQSAEMGFAAHELAVAEIAHPRWPRDREALLGFYDRLVERTEGLPGIESATPVILSPFSGEGGWNAVYKVEGQGESEVAGNPGLNFEAVEPGYFETFGTPILRGRAFSGTDREGAVPVAIVSEALARRAWPGEDPIGKRLKLGASDSDEPWLTVVGMVPEVRYRDLVDAPPTLYVPLRQTPVMAPHFLVVRATAGSPELQGAVRALVRGLEPEARVVEIASFPDLMRVPLAGPRFNAWILSLVAGIALVLASVGLYGVLAASVAQRSREMGVRMALGASSGAVKRMVLRQGLTLVALGVVAGLLASFALTRLLASILFEVRPTDPATLAAVIGVLIGAGLVACYLPARRATHADPMVVLRTE